MRVYKYLIDLSTPTLDSVDSVDSVDIARISMAMHNGARVLTVQMQHDVACLWALVDPDQPVIAREFVIVGTGQDLPPGVRQWTHHGSFQVAVAGGVFVFHLFEAGVPVHNV